MGRYEEGYEYDQLWTLSMEVCGVIILMQLQDVQCRVDSQKTRRSKTLYKMPEIFTKHLQTPIPIY